MSTNTDPLCPCCGKAIYLHMMPGFVRNDTLYDKDISLFATTMLAMKELQSALAATQARLAAFEEGYDPAVKPPEDNEDVFVKVNDGRCYMAVFEHLSGDAVNVFSVIPFGDFVPTFDVADIIRWFPTPGAKEEE